MNQLSHLPESKQKELAEIVTIIREIADPAKIILFGSHTSDKWVEDEYVENGATYAYISDYDILVVLADGDKRKEQEVASKITNRTGKFKNEVSTIVHTISYINEGLESGQYFFRDIVREGIVLFDSGEHNFVQCKPLTGEQIKDNAINDFEKWVKGGSLFLDGTKNLLENALSKGYQLNQVVFNLNQTAEKFYGGVSLVFTGYKPKTHRLTAYRTYTKHISEGLNQVFNYPPDDSEEKRLFEILNDSYIDARYKYDYSIDLRDLQKLISKVEKLEQVVVDLCQQRIKSL